MNPEVTALLWWLDSPQDKESLTETLRKIQRGIYGGSPKNAFFNLATQIWESKAGQLPSFDDSKDAKLVIDMVPLDEKVLGYYKPLFTALLEAQNQTPEVALLEVVKTGDPSKADQLSDVSSEVYKAYTTAVVAIKTFRQHLADHPELKEAYHNMITGDLWEHTGWKPNQLPTEAVQEVGYDKDDFGGKEVPYDLSRIVWVGPLTIKVPVFERYEVYRLLTIQPDATELNGLRMGQLLWSLYMLYNVIPLSKADIDELIEKKVEDSEMEHVLEALKRGLAGEKVRWFDFVDHNYYYVSDLYYNHAIKQASVILSP